MAGRLPEAADAANPIDGERAARARLDYLALGDWHGTLEIAPRTWYAGTPEPDRFRANDAGNVLLVELDDAGRGALGGTPCRPHVTRGASSGSTSPWTADPNAALDRLFADAGRLDRAIVQLDARRGARSRGARGLEVALVRWAGEFCHLEICDDLVAEPSERDLVGLADVAGDGHRCRRTGRTARAQPDPDERAVACPGPAPALPRAPPRWAEAH